MTQAYISFQFLSHLGHFFPDHLLIRIADMDNNDARQIPFEPAKFYELAP
jgi:glucan biosynthesis protein